jgi:SNF2 family DNA or RNA helicase
MTTVTIEDGHILIRTDFSYKDVCKAIPGGKWNPERKAWVYPWTKATADSIVRACRDSFHIDPPEELVRVSQCVDEHLADVRENPKKYGPEHAVRPAWEHQCRGYGMIRALPATMLAWDMGAGKTKPPIDFITSIPACKALIACPSSVVDVWPREFAKDAGTAVEVVALRAGSVKKRLAQASLALRKAQALKKPVAIVINYEAIWRKPFGDWAIAQGWDIVIADEIHRIKSPGGVASKFMHRLGKSAKRRVGLSGTPMAHSPLDVYAQYRFLDEGIFGTSFTRFRSRYAIMGGYQPKGARGPVQVLGFQNQDELHDKFYSIADRVTKDEVLDLPDVIHQVVPVTLEEGAQRLYDEMEREMIIEVEEGTVTASNALAKLLRLQQITSGASTTEDGEVAVVSTAKQKALGDLMMDLPPTDPLVVFARFRHDLDSIRAEADEAGRESFEISGREKSWHEWMGACKNKSGRGPVLAVQIQAGGLGLDFTAARYCVYYSIGFSLGDYEQSLARVHRPGQVHKVTYMHLVAQQTIDEKVYQTLEKRADVIRSVLEWCKGKGDDDGR